MGSRAIVASPKSVIRGFSEASTTIFGCAYTSQRGHVRVDIDAYSFEIPMDHVARMEINKAFSDAQQLRKEGEALCGCERK